MSLSMCHGLTTYREIRTWNCWKDVPWQHHTVTEQLPVPKSGYAQCPPPPSAIPVITEISYNKWWGSGREKFLCKWRGPEVQQLCVCAELLARAHCWHWPQLTSKLNGACSSQQQSWVSDNSICVHVHNLPLLSSSY